MIDDRRAGRRARGPGRGVLPRLLHDRARARRDPHRRALPGGRCPRAALQEFARRHGDFAIVVAVVVGARRRPHGDAARSSLGGVDDVPLRIARGRAACSRAPRRRRGVRRGGARAAAADDRPVGRPARQPRVPPGADRGLVRRALAEAIHADRGATAMAAGDGRLPVTDAEAAAIGGRWVGPADPRASRTARHLTGDANVRRRHPRRGPAARRVRPLAPRRRAHRPGIDTAEAARDARASAHVAHRRRPRRPRAARPAPQPPRVRGRRVPAARGASASATRASRSRSSSPTRRTPPRTAPSAIAVDVRARRRGRDVDRGGARADDAPARARRGRLQRPPRRRRSPTTPALDAALDARRARRSRPTFDSARLTALPLEGRAVPGRVGATATSGVIAVDLDAGPAPRPHRPSPRSSASPSTASGSWRPTSAAASGRSASSRARRC